MQADADGTGTVPVDDDVRRRAVEQLDVLLHPVERSDLVQHAVVTRRLDVRRRKEAQDVQSVGDRHHENLNLIGFVVNI